MFFEIWKRQNKKKLDILNKIAPHIEPTEQSKKIAQEIAKQINIETVKSNAKEIK